MGEFRMPSLGADMVAGTLVEWRIQPGATVRRGDIVAEVETDKGAIEVEIFEDGIVERLLVEPGAKVPVGTSLAVIRGAGGEGPTPEAAPPAPEPAPRTRAGTRVSPLARRQAEALGVDLETLVGTGAGGAVTAADVRAAAESARVPAGGRPTGMRRAIGAAMARSKREIPHYYLVQEIEVGSLLGWLAERNAAVPISQRMLVAAPLLKAVALALREEPGFNGFFLEDGFQPSEAIHVGVAIRLRDGGLVAPAIHHADRLTVPELMEAMQDLIGRARSGSMRSSELADPTVTVTSLGDQGVDAVFGVIFPPQVAIVGLGRIRDRPWAEGAMLGVRPVLTASLSADHRVSDGYAGARLLDTLAQLLRDPERL